MFYLLAKKDLLSLNNCLSANFNLDRHVNYHDQQMRLNKSDVRRQIQLPLCHFSNKVDHTHPCLMACVMMDLPSFPTKSIICCLSPPQAPNGQIHQVWYDDPQSICPKAAYVKAAGLRGIGMWNGNILDYSDEPVARQQTAAMWNALLGC